MNSVTLVGRLTRNPELREGNTPVCKFTLAVGREFNKDETDFIPIVVFGKQANSCSTYLAKGSMAAVRGRIQTGSYENKEGRKVYTTDVIADRVEFLGGKKEKQEYEGFHEFKYDSDDIPF